MLQTEEVCNKCYDAFPSSLSQQNGFSQLAICCYCCLPFKSCKSLASFFVWCFLSCLLSIRGESVVFYHHSPLARTIFGGKHNSYFCPDSWRELRMCLWVWQFLNSRPKAGNKMPLPKSNAGHAHTHRDGGGGGRLCQLPFNFRSGNTHFCIAIRIAMLWDAMSAERNETKWNGMEQNDDDRRHSTSACSLHNCLHLLHIFAFYFLLHSVYLTLTLLLLSLELLFCVSGRQLQQFAARPLSTQKKKVTNKKRVKIKKKKLQQQENCTTERGRGVPGVGEAWHVDFVLCAVFSANVRSFCLRHILLFSRLGL